MKKLSILTLALSAIGFTACNNSNENVHVSDKSEPESGTWRGSISLNDSIDLPFIFEWKTKDSLYSMSIRNGEERIEVKDITKIGDSLKIQMPVFANYIIAAKGNNKMEGYFVKPDAKNYRLPFSASFGDSARFESVTENCCDINNKWRVEFSPGTEEQDDAIAYFEQEGSRVEGTVMTPTGDYRYLDGVLSGNKMKLSTFDGAFLYYFESKVEGGQEMEGRFYSGRSHMEPWRAYRDEDFELPDADTLTWLREGYDSLSFSFPDLSGDSLSLSDQRFEDKPVIVQIMGSWCPNCMDETRYLKQVYDRYHNEGLEIVGLTFERARDRKTALLRAQKMKDDLQIPYPVLLAGATRDDNAAEALPMLNHIMSYPTTIYLNRDHEVVKIHTGFNGPGTPVYEKFVAENKSTIERLVRPQNSNNK